MCPLSRDLQTYFSFLCVVVALVVHGRGRLTLRVLRHSKHLVTVIWRHNK